jgi:hypothetical protein
LPRWTAWVRLAAGGSQLPKGAGTACLDGVFGNEKLRGDLVDC